MERYPLWPLFQPVRGGADLQRSDSLGNGNSCYRPTLWLTLQLSGQYQRCSFDLALANYVTNIVALGLRLTP